MQTAMTAPAPKVGELEAARILNVSPFTLRRWRKEGTGPAFLKIGPRRVAYDPADLEAFAQSGRRGAPTATRRPLI